MAVEPARASLIDGKAFSQTLVERVAAAAARLESAHGVKPGLAVVIVGEDPASQLYVRNKGETTLKAGMRSDTHRLPAETTQDELLALIASLNADAGIHGILVQLPLPKHIDSAPVLDAISPDKDVDGFHVVNAGRLAVGLPEGKAQTIIAGHADGVFAALMLVVLKKYLYERGSPEADDPPEDADATQAEQTKEDTGRPPQG